MKRAILSGFTFAALISSWLASAQCVAEFNGGGGLISPPFVLTNGYIFQPASTDGTNGGRAVYSFTVPAEGQYAIQAFAEVLTKEAGSLLVDIDSEPKDPDMIWELAPTTGFATNWVSIGKDKTPKYFHLTQGHHQIIIRGRSSNVKLAHIRVLARPKPPAGLRMVIGQ